jgi:predicted peptidase
MMRRLLVLGTLMITPGNAVSFAKDPKPGVQVEAATEVTLGTGDSAKKVTVHYLIALPDGYNKQEKCPLMIFLHGRGEWGDNLNRVKIHGPPKNVKNNNTTPFIIVSPQSPKGEYWKVEKLSRLLDHILATTKSDPERVYLTGLSMGGFGTWSWAASEPQRFAAAIPICGGGNPRNAEKLVNLPIWAFHGGKDNVVALSKSEAMVDAIRGAGGTKVKLTIYPEARHDSWTKTYNNPEIYNWLLAHKRAK